MLADRRRRRLAIRAALVALVLLAASSVGLASSAGATGRAVAEAASVAEPLPEPHQDPATSRARADEILARPEYQVPEPPITTRITKWVGEQLGRLLTALFTGGVGSALAWGILALVLAGLAVLVSRVTRTVQHEPVRAGPVLAVERRRTPGDWRHEADACESRGAWKDALRCRFRALVAELLIRQLVRDLPGRTSGEYRADVAANLPAAATEFAGAAELFERAWYGDLPTGPDECARIRELSDLIVAQAGRPNRHAEAEIELEAVPS